MACIEPKVLINSETILNLWKLITLSDNSPNKVINLSSIKEFSWKTNCILNKYDWNKFKKSFWEYASSKGFQKPESADSKNDEKEDEKIQADNEEKDNKDPKDNIEDAIDIHFFEGFLLKTFAN